MELWRPRAHVFLEPQKHTHRPQATDDRTQEPHAHLHFSRQNSFLFFFNSCEAEAMANSLVIGLRVLFAALGCAMTVTLVYTLSVDGLPFRKDLLTPYTLSLSFILPVFCFFCLFNYFESFGIFSVSGGWWLP